MVPAQSIADLLLLLDHIEPTWNRAAVFHSTGSKKATSA